MVEFLQVVASVTRQMMVDFHLSSEIAISKISDSRKNVEPGNKRKMHFKLVAKEAMLLGQA